MTTPIPAGLSILVVDDEAIILGGIARRLQRQGHLVAAASSFIAGRNLIDSADDPDVLITDVRMPGGSGLDLVERARSRYPKCRIIVMTGHLDESQIGMVKDRGAAAVLFKPFSFRNLLALLGDAYPSEAPTSSRLPRSPIASGAT